MVKKEIGWFALDRPRRNTPRVQNTNTRECGISGKKTENTILLFDYYILDGEFALNNFGDQGVHFFSSGCLPGQSRRCRTVRVIWVRWHGFEDRMRFLPSTLLLFIPAWDWHYVVLACSLAPPVAEIKPFSVTLTQNGLAESMLYMWKIS